MPPNALNKDYTGPTRVYIGVGKEGSLDGSGNHVMEEEAKQLAELVQEHASKSVEVYYDFMPAENHATSLHPAVFNAIRWLYKK